MTIMEFTKGSIRVQFLIQRFLNPPFLIQTAHYKAPNTDNKTHKNNAALEICPNPFRNQKTRRGCFHKISSKFWWLFMKLNSTFLILACVSRNLWLFANWNRLKDFEQFGFLATLAAISGIARASLTAMDGHVSETCYLLKQTIKILREHSIPINISHHDWKQVFKERPSKKELFIYSMTLGIFAFPVVIATVPLFRGYDPIQLCIVNFWKLLFSSRPPFTAVWVIKIMCSAYYALLGCHDAAGVFTVMLFICIIMVEACVHLSRELFPCKKQKHLQDLEFSKCIHTFRVIQILIQIEYWIIHTFLTVLVSMGVVTTAWGGYVMLVMYSRFPLVIYISCCVIFFFCIAVNFLLVTLAGIPNRNGKRFVGFWKKGLTQRQDRMMLRSCPNIGFSLGVVKAVKFQTALTIMDVMINCTVTLALMKVNNGKSWR